MTPADEWAELEARAKAALVMGLSFDAAMQRRTDMNAAANPATILELIEAARQSDGGWQPIETAPRDGTPIIGMARYASATAGFPRFVCWQDGAWREPGRSAGEALVCWAWMPRDILPAWPAEPFPRRVTIQATGFSAPHQATRTEDGK